MSGPLHAFQSLPQVTARALADGGDRPLIRFVGGKDLSVTDVRDRSSQLAQALEAHGIAKGSRLALLSGNRPEVLLLYNATGSIGACLIPLHPLGAVDDYTYIFDDAGIDCLIFDAERFAPKVEELQSRGCRIKTYLGLGPSTLGSDLSAEAEGFAARSLAPPDVDPEEMSRINYSGGTTGKPKGIVASHRSARATLDIMLSEWEWPAVPRTLVCAPLSHSGGPLFTPTLLRGGSLVVLPAFEPVAVMQAIQDYRINCTLLVPTMIYSLLDHPRFDEFDLSSLETIFYGASLMSPTRLQEAIRRIGPVFFQFYGQAEAPMTVTVLKRADHDPDDLTRLSSCGRPTPLLDVALLDSDNRRVADGEPGEICVRGPLVMTAYLNKAEQTAEALDGDWLHTGDVAVRDAGGFLRIVDRKKDMIITGGFNVYPREVEDVLTSHPGVAQAAVFGVPDPHWGEVVTAAIVRKPGAEPSTAELIELVRFAKGPVQAPKIVEFIDKVPVTAVGKPDKKALRAAFADRTAAA